MLAKAPPLERGSTLSRFGAGREAAPPHESSDVAPWGVGGHRADSRRLQCPPRSGSDGQATGPVVSSWHVLVAVLYVVGLVALWLVLRRRHE